MNQLERELIRLFNVGRKKPTGYMSTLTTSAMMLLFLNKKYGIVDCSTETLKEQYREYGKLTARQKALKGTPAFCVWELNVNYDDKGNLLSTNHDDYYIALYWKLWNIIEANPGQKVFCTLDITSFRGDEPTSGHMEIIIYDPVRNTVEHVDSNQLPKQCTRREPGYFACKEAIHSMMRKITETLPCKPKYINNNDIYGDYEFGVQSMECISDILTPTEQEGFCLMWAMLFAELALKYQECSMKEIIQTMIRRSKAKDTDVAYINDYFAYLIRGFVSEVARELSISFMDEASMHEACVRLVE